MRARVIAGVFLFALLAHALASQEPAETKPLTNAEFVGLVNAKTPVDDVIAQIRARGINFEASAELEASLLQIEGGPQLLAALREPATLEVSVNVAGAEVTVDGESRGAASADAAVTVSGLKPGNHLIRVQAEKFVGERTDVFLKPGETRRVKIALLPAVEARPGLLGMEVNLRAGTKEDALVARLESVSDPAVRARQVQDMIREYAEGPLALLGYRMLQAAYLEQNNYDGAVAAGEEILRRDPGNFQAQMRQAGAHLGKGDLPAAFESLGAARRLLEQGRERVVEASGQSSIEQSQARQALEDGQRAVDSLSYNFFAGSLQLTDPAKKVAALERFLEVYPTGDYTQGAWVNLAYAYQQTNEPAKSLAAANRALEGNPREASMMVLVADSLSERGENLARARQLATSLLEVVEDPAARPGGMVEEQWASFGQLWQGMAHSILGQVLMHEETSQSPAGMSKTRQAVKEFQAATPLLKEQTQLYARNLFRLGFAYAKLGELVAARDALNEVIALNTAFTPPAQELLERVGQAMQRRRQ